MESKLTRGVVTDREVAESYARFYRGIAVSDAVHSLTSIACIDDISAGVQLLRQRSVDAVIATVSWSFAACGLAELWGFSTGCGAELELSSGTFAGRVTRHFAPADKVAFVADYCAQAGYSMDQVVAIGDSRSDLPLFESVGFSVALNATRDARALASACIDSPSLLPALQAVPGLLN